MHVSKIDLSARDQAVVGQVDLHVPRPGIDHGQPVVNLDLLSPGQRHLQPVGEVVGNVVAPNRQHAGVLDDTGRVHSILGYAGTEVDHQRAQFLLLGA